MSIWRLRFVVGLVAAGCFFCSPIAASAKGLPAEVTVSGAGLSSPLHLTDPFVAASLGTATFMQVDEPLAYAPAGLGSFYEIERDGFDHVRYYPGGSLSHSYVYYEGLVNGSSEYDGHWYPVSASGDTTIRMLLVAGGVQDGEVVGGMSPFTNQTLGQARAILAASATARVNGQRASGSVPDGAWLAYVGVAGLLIGGGLGAFARTMLHARRTTV